VKYTRRLLSLVLAGLVLSVTWAGPAAAHPLGNFTINRFSGIEVQPRRVVVHYVVDMAEVPTFQERPHIDVDGNDRVTSSELQTYANGLGPTLTSNLLLTANGDAIDLRVVDVTAVLLDGQGGLDVLRIEATSAGVLPTPEVSLTYEDGNYRSRIGWKEIVAYASGGQGIVSSTVPSRSASAELTRYPRTLLSSPLDVTRARVDVAPGASGPRMAPAETGGRASPLDAFAGVFASLIEKELSPAFLLFALMLAGAAGALHALGPGHGKTVMAAYLVGAEGRARHALAVGVAVSLMHTASVVALGVFTLWASSVFPPEAVYPWLSLVSGIVVLCLGAYLLWTRARARMRMTRPRSERWRIDRTGHHVHDGHAHRAGEHVHHVHSHGVAPHEHIPSRSPSSPLSGRGLAALALSGGLLPSPTALVVLLGAVALHRVAFGVTLVAAFSVGLAAALSLLGLLVVKARGYAAARFGHASTAVLPIGSAALIVAMGLFLTTRAALGF
jgi:nickel/cobalt transporter (NicO) family protein